jgi:hypothetical protein
MQPNPAPGQRKTEAERAAIMQQRLRELAFYGYTISAVDGPRAAVWRGAPVNHILHLLLSVFTCGLWLPVWLLIMMFGGTKQQHIYIDEYGNLIGNGLPIGPQGGPRVR